MGSDGVSTGGAGRRGESRSSGFTLIELLLVISLLGLLLGAGVGLLAGMDLESDTAPERVRAALLSMQGAALAEQLPAHARLSADRRSLSIDLPRARQSWHFEAAGEGLALSGAKLVEDGFLGRGLDLQAAPLDGRAELDLVGRAELAGASGFALRFELRLAGEEGGEIVTCGEGLSLRLDSEDRLVAMLAAGRRDAAAGPAAGASAGNWTIQTEPGLLVRGRWQSLTLLADGQRFELWIDGLRAAAVALELEAGGARVQVPEGSLRLGGRPRPFPGQIDELTLYAFEAADRLDLPERVDWPPDGPVLLSYGPDGTLEQARQRPLTLALRLPGGVERPLLLTSRGIADG
jgi:prepilin-type N-terminal cleavage/methylation domain-containing protein